jgi:hypothetical protein
MENLALPGNGAPPKESRPSGATNRRNEENNHNGITSKEAVVGFAFLICLHFLDEILAVLQMPVGWAFWEIRMRPDKIGTEILRLACPTRCDSVTTDEAE